MQYDKIAKSYKAQSVQTASPGKLVLMLFDGYLRFTTAAATFDETDFTKRNGVCNLIRAQNIVTELQSLDMSVPSDTALIACTTMSFINCNNQFAEETEPIDEADKVISELGRLGPRCTQNPDGGIAPDQQSGSISFSLVRTLVSKAKFNRFLELLEFMKIYACRDSGYCCRDLDAVDQFLKKMAYLIFESKDELGSNPSLTRFEKGISKVLDLQENINSTKLHKDISLSKKGKMDFIHLGISD